MLQQDDVGSGKIDLTLSRAQTPAVDLDRDMMMRCIALAVRSGRDGEYPYGVVICREGEVIAESINRVAHERDVTRHAEVVAISAAQKALGTVSLDDCTIYVSAEPCAYCSYAMRESRIARVVYGLHSPHMGGVSKWNVLGDEGLCSKLPEVFDPPPEIVGGFMAAEVERALLKSHPVMWGIIRKRGLFVARAPNPMPRRQGERASGSKLLRRLIASLRPLVFDRFGRGM